MDKKAVLVSFTALLPFGFLYACATQSARTVKTETTHYSEKENPHSHDPVIVEKQTTETTDTKKTENEPDGVVSGTVNAVGEIVALPFRAVGGLIRSIF